MCTALAHLHPNCQQIGMADCERTRAQTRAKMGTNVGDDVEEPAEAFDPDLGIPTLNSEEGVEPGVKPNLHETGDDGGESSGKPRRLNFKNLEDRAILLGEVDAFAFFGPLAHGSKGKMAAEMQDNLLKYRSPSFPHGAMCSQRTFESQTEKELMYYQDRLAGKGEESGDHLNTSGNAEINRLCESINKHKSDRDEYEALSANEKLKAIALKEDLKQRAEEARTAALENLDKDNRSGTPRRSPTTLPQEQPPPPRHRKNSWPYPPLF